MANLFADLPHMLGTITNLDGAGSMRALASIRAELARRQTVFNQVGVNNINAYTKAFKAQQATDVVTDEADGVSVMEPLPHLFIISDEFAELKKEQPEFMAELVSTARIGRSLGVHLILATQKPSNVVDDQIWSNSKFKLALKVATEGDSNEILKTPDAARITQPGRAYLQVGNNEVYELFQSAWSGAPYVDGAKIGGVDRRVWVINELGQGELANQDLSTVDPSADASQDQLAVMVGHIAQVHSEFDLAPVTKPWLPPLAEQIVNPAFAEIIDVGLIDKLDMAAKVGLVDDPSTQSQYEFIHDFTSDGNMGVFGAPASGKTTTLASTVMSLAAKNNPQLLQFQILDFGNNGLSALSRLPHTGNYVPFDDTELLGKVVEYLDKQLTERKTAFKEVGAFSHAMFNQIASEQDTPRLPAILVVIDNFDAAKELGDAFEAFLIRLARDGQSLGVNVLIAASRVNVLRQVTVASLRRKITHYQTETADVTAVVGRASVQLSEQPGRMLVNLGEPLMAQVFLPVEHTGDLGYASALRELANSIAEGCSTIGSGSVKVVPAVIGIEDLGEGWSSQTPSVGLCMASTNPKGFNSQVPIHVVVGPPASGKTNILRLLLAQQAERPDRVFVADTGSGDLAEIGEQFTYMETSTQAVGFLETLAAHIDKLATKREAEQLRLKEFIATHGASWLVIDDLGMFVRALGPKANEAAEIVTRGAEHGLVTVASLSPSTSLPPGLPGLFKGAQSGVVLGAAEMAGHLPVKAPAGHIAHVTVGFHHFRGTTSKIRIPNTISEHDTDEHSTTEIQGAAA